MIKLKLKQIKYYIFFKNRIYKNSKVMTKIKKM